jgi:hypothetical protein
VAPATPAVSGVNAVSASAWPASARGDIDDDVLQLALGAVNCAERSGIVSNPPTLTVIDYSKPSTERRLWVFDLRSHALLFEELVAHGSGSGENLATRFSNDAESHRTSLGLFETADTYVGANGYSLRLDGLEPGFNDRARARAIVVHGAAYVSDAIARAQGRLGRSWGCPALPLAVASTIINRVKGGSLLFAYYPDRTWLGQSKFLGGCTAASATAN